MSLRSALYRSARPALAAARAQVTPISRRAASSGSHSSSNLPWALGSATVFGSLTAFILMPKGSEAAHHIHDQIDAKGQGAHVREGDERPEHEKEEHANAKELMLKERASGDRPTRDEDPKGKMVHANESKPRTEIPSKRDDEKPARRGPSTGEAFDGTIDGSEAKAGLANKGTGDRETSGDSSKSEDKDGQSVTDSVKQAVKSNAPKVAAAAEEKGEQVKEAVSSATSGSGSEDKDADAPSQQDIVDSIHLAEKSNSPRMTMANEK